MELTEKRKENLRKWVAALESGKYRQTRGRLKGKYGYCCLGVWCDVGLRGHWKDGCFVRSPGTQNMSDTLGRHARQALGITALQEDEYIHLNDNSKKNFKAIAARIRDDHPEAFNDT